LSHAHSAGRGERAKETNIKRQATRHDCLLSFLGDGGKWSEIVLGEGKKYFVMGWLEQPRQNKNFFYWHAESNELSKKRPLSYMLIESPFASVSTVSRGNPSLVSLGRKKHLGKYMLPVSLGR
jgi:hypothetical protein